MDRFDGSGDEIQAQLQRLEIYRGNLQHLERKAALYGGKSNLPLHDWNEFNQQLHNIALIKTWLIDHKVVVIDLPNEPVVQRNPQQLASSTATQAAPDTAVANTTVVPKPADKPTTEPQRVIAPAEKWQTIDVYFDSNQTTSRIWWKWRTDNIVVDFQPPYSSDALVALLAALEAQLLDPGNPTAALGASICQQLAALGFYKPSEQRLLPKLHEELGRRYFEPLVASASALQLLDRAQQRANNERSRLEYVLHFSPQTQASNLSQLYAIPWELLHRPDGPLLLRQNRFDSCVRYISTSHASEVMPIRSGKLRLLVVSPKANMPASIRARTKAARDEALKPLIEAGELELVEVPADQTTLAALLDFIDDLPPFDIVHFCGHGRLQAGVGQLLFDAPDNGQQWVMAKQLYGVCDARLIVLEACQGAAIDHTRFASGVAPTLVSAGVTAVIAMQFSIHAQAASVFCSAVYKGLAARKSLQEAVAIGRRRLYLTGDDISWAAPTLVMSAQQTQPFFV